ncbi:hypothetical protein B0H19DRAFT_1272529 [Mycena capillaripes]|nr:hypothetical protein B0H19DRAFT_1272477 [Mycena capillaripes]KAJ6533130.1 hypothetical protein B0H19DRAFT_1272529 [Mycena capillaripes]
MFAHARNVKVKAQNVINTTNNFYTTGPKREEIIDWLSQLFFLRQAELSRTRQQETGEWLLTDPDFQEWESGLEGLFVPWNTYVTSTFLLPHTDPNKWLAGAGKTVLVSKVVDYLQEKSEKSKNKDIGVACVYLNHKEADIQTPTAFLGGLWR